MSGLVMRRHAGRLPGRVINEDKLDIAWLGGHFKEIDGYTKERQNEDKQPHQKDKHQMRRSGDQAPKQQTGLVSLARVDTQPGGRRFMIGRNGL